MSPTRVVGAIWIAAVLFWTGAAASRPPRVRSPEHRVEMRWLAFTPARIRVEPGDTVSWRNDDIVPHTVTASDDTWDSGDLPPGGEFRWVVGRSGTIAYLCRYHPQMTGRLDSGTRPRADSTSRVGAIPSRR